MSGISTVPAWVTDQDVATARLAKRQAPPKVAPQKINIDAEKEAAVAALDAAVAALNEAYAKQPLKPCYDAIICIECALQAAREM